MASPLSDAVFAHFDAMAASGGVSVTYSRGGDSVDLTAIPGRTDHDVFGDDGGTVSYQSRDYLIKRSDLVLDSSEELPQRFDVITEDGDAYEVRAPVGEKSFEYSDQYKQILRVFTIDQS